MKNLKLIFFICGTVLMSNAVMGQGLSDESIKAHMVTDWERAKLYTKEYLDAMPEEGANFKPSPDIRSFAEQMLHLSQGTIGLIATGTGSSPILQGKTLEKMEEYKNKAALSQVVLQAYDFAINALKNMDSSKMYNVVKRGNFEATQFSWLNKAFEHQTHHRGQTTIYLRLKGIKPPNERLF